LIANFHGAFLVLDGIVAENIHWVDGSDEGEVVQVALRIGQASSREAESVSIIAAGFDATFECLCLASGGTGIGW
jgi:hypothetical protein